VRKKGGETHQNNSFLTGWTWTNNKCFPKRYNYSVFKLVSVRSNHKKKKKLVIKLLEIYLW